MSPPPLLMACQLVEEHFCGFPYETDSVRGSQIKGHTWNTIGSKIEQLAIVLQFNPFLYGRFYGKGERKEGKEKGRRKGRKEGGMEGRKDPHSANGILLNKLFSLILVLRLYFAV